MPLLKIPFGPFDLGRQVRRLSMYTHSRLQSQSQPWQDTYIIHSVVLPTDLDENYHMNNARYLREADMARQNMWFHNGIMDAMHQRRIEATASVHKSGGAVPRIGFVLASSSIRYRKEISCWQKIEVHCRLIGWDSKTFYVEEIFVSRGSNGEVTIHAYMLGAQQPIGVTPAELMTQLGYSGPSPRMQEHVQQWIKSEAASRKHAPKDGKQLEEYMKRTDLRALTSGSQSSSSSSSSSSGLQAAASSIKQRKPTEEDMSRYHSQMAVTTTGNERLDNNSSRSPSSSNKSSNRGMEQALQGTTGSSLSSNMELANVDSGEPLRSNQTSGKAQQSFSDSAERFSDDEENGPSNADEANIEAELQWRSSL